MIEDTLCPDCGLKMVSRTNRKTSEVFWGCPAYPKCTGTRDNQGRSKDERQAEREKEQYDKDNPKGARTFRDDFSFDRNS